MNKNIHIIGSGFSALASSCYLAKQGYSVTVLEKNDTLGGRARQFKKDGFYVRYRTFLVLDARRF